MKIFKPQFWWEKWKFRRKWLDSANDQAFITNGRGSICTKNCGRLNTFFKERNLLIELWTPVKHNFQIGICIGQRKLAIISSQWLASNFSFWKFTMERNENNRSAKEETPIEDKATALLGVPEPWRRDWGHVKKNKIKEIRKKKVVSCTITRPHNSISHRSTERTSIRINTPQKSTSLSRHRDSLKVNP